MDNGRTRFVVFLFGNPHLLESGQGRQDRATNPDSPSDNWATTRAACLDQRAIRGDQHQHSCIWFDWVYLLVYTFVGYGEKWVTKFFLKTSRHNLPVFQSILINMIMRCKVYKYTSTDECRDKIQGLFWRLVQIHFIVEYHSENIKPIMSDGKPPLNIRL